MILTIKLIIIMKCRGRYRTPITTNTEFLVTLHNGQKPLNSIKKAPPPSDALYMPLKWLIHHLR